MGGQDQGQEGQPVVGVRKSDSLQLVEVDAAQVADGRRSLWAVEGQPRAQRVSIAPQCCQAEMLQLGKAGCKAGQQQLKASGCRTAQQ